MLVGIACAALLVSGGGLAGAALVKSPAQAAADTLPPKPQWLTTPVTRKVLAQTVVTRGTVAPTASFQISPPASSSQGAAVQLVTAVHKTAGAAVKAGDVLLDVSGRPVVVLPGALPAYRDLKPADDGADVAQLQNALRTLGFYSDGDGSGTFGPATKDAITAFYRHLGYDVPTTGGAGDAGDQSTLSSAQDAVDAAQRAVDDMKRQIAAASTAAQATPAPSTSAQPPSGQEPLSLQLQYLQKQLAKAQQAQTDLIAKTGPMLPLAEVVFVPTLPATVTSVSARVGAAVGSSALMTLSTGRLGISAQMSTDQGQLLKAGMKVSIVSETLGQTATGTIGDVGPVTTAQPAAAGGDGQTGGQPAQSSGQQAPDGTPYLPVTVTPDAALGPDWAGQDVRLTITSAATPAPVLVPVAAVSAGADGRTTVSKLGAGGQPVRVDVTTGLSADGFVEVTPVTAGSLTEADAVVVGQ